MSGNLCCILSFAAGTANYTNENISFISHAKRNHFRYWPGELSGLSRSRKTVELGSVSMPDGEKLPGGSFSYDTLILAVGSRANDFGTPGVIENCHFIDDIGQALLFSGDARVRLALLRDGGDELAILELDSVHGDVHPRQIYR